MSDKDSQSRAAGASPTGPLGFARQLSRRLRVPLRLRDPAGGDPSLPGAARLASGGPPLRLGRPPLPLTSLVLLVLLLLPALQLVRMPRPRAVGLEQLLGDSSLLQSFPATPERPVPALWSERLGVPLAESLWRRQRGPWWQFWGQHADAAPLLAFSASSLPGGPAAALPANGLRVGDLVVVAPDPLSRQLLRDRLLPQQRLSRGLNRRCLDRLRQQQAVLWNSTGMGVITGPVAPLLQRLSRGCLSFALAADGLSWQGEAGDAEGLLASPDSISRGTAEALSPLPADRLLELEGGATDLLLAGLLSRPLIRDPLNRRYGLDAARLALLRRTPFRLQLRPLSQGPFQASLELQLPVGTDKRSWDALLEQLSRTLVQQGLSPAAAAAQPRSSRPDATASAQARPASAATAEGTPPDAAANPGVAAKPADGRLLQADGATWKREDGVIVGGWRWISPAQGEPQLLFFLGPVPAEPLLPIPDVKRALPGAGGLRLRSRPEALHKLGLLPADVPELVRRSDQLWMVAEPAVGADPARPLSLLSGGLRVRR